MAKRSRATPSFQDIVQDATAGVIEFPLKNPVKETQTFDEQDPFQNLFVSRSNRLKQIWTVGGGKGGVGKSLICSNFAISLARAGNQVIAIDLDLGGANLHTALGVKLPSHCLGDFVYGRVPQLNECAFETPIQNLKLISGAHDSTNMPNLSTEQKIKLLRSLRELDADYLVVDLGAGSQVNTIDFFLYGDIGLIMMLPEPTSIENAYRFIKSAYYRRLEITPRLKPVRHLIQIAKDAKNELNIKTPADLFREIKKQSEELAEVFKNEIESFQFKLILNQARTQTDIDIGHSVKSVVKKYFGIEIDYIGYIDYDSAVWQSIRRKRPILLEFPNSQISSSVERMTQYLLKRSGHIRNNIF